MDSTKTNTPNVDSATTYSLLISLLTVIALSAGGYFAYQQGYLDPLIEKVGVLVFKAKAVAEAKEMQAKGMTAGKDFVGCKPNQHTYLVCYLLDKTLCNCLLTDGKPAQLDGNEQAEDVKQGLGSIGSLKKDL
jgi:hypothetical protein